MEGGKKESRRRKSKCRPTNGWEARELCRRKAGAERRKKESREMREAESPVQGGGGGEGRWSGGRGATGESGGAENFAPEK